MIERVRVILRDEQAFFASFFLIFLFLVIRNPNALIYPPALAEDGPIMMAYFFNHHSVISVFRAYAGYVSLGPNILGYLASKLGITFTPYALSLLPLLIDALTFSVISLRYFDKTGVPIETRLVLSLLAAALPVSNYLLVSNTTFSLWNMYILLAVLMVFWTPISRMGYACAVMIFFVLIWSHPLSLTLAPIIFIRIFRSKKYADKLFNFLILVIMVSYYVFGINHRVALHHHFPLELVLPIWSQTFLERDIFATLFTSARRMMLVGLGLQWSILWVSSALLVLLGILALRQHRLGRFNAESFIIFLYLSIATSFISVYTRGVNLMDAIVQRYTYAAAIFLVFSIALGFLSQDDRSYITSDRHMKIAHRQKAGGPVFGWNQFGNYLSDYKRVIAVITAWILVVNITSANFFYRTSATSGERIRALTSIAEANAHKETTRWCIKLDRGGMNITLNKWHIPSKRCTLIKSRSAF